MSDKFILDGKRVIPCDDLMLWASWFEESRDTRKVARTVIGPYTVSTVFLGLDHSHGAEPPQIFETMTFDENRGGDEADDGDLFARYSTWEEAERGYAEIVERVKAKAS